MNELLAPREMPAQSCVHGGCGRLQVLRKCDFPFWSKGKKKFHLFLYNNTTSQGSALFTKGAE